MKFRDDINDTIEVNGWRSLCYEMEFCKIWLFHVLKIMF